MKTVTEIKIEDGEYSSDAQLEIKIRIPKVIGSIYQKELRSAIDAILNIYRSNTPTKAKK